MSEAAKMPPTWGTPEQEYRSMAKDCVEMGRPDLAIQFTALAEQEARKADAFVFVAGSK